MKHNALYEEKILNHIQTKWVAQTVVLLKETGSTNEEAGRLALEGYPHGTLVIAEKQTNGKGRRGRVWHTSQGSSIAMSLILKPQLEPEYASMLTLVQAMAVAKGIEEVCEVKTQIKWPNDILVHEKKVCGILTQMNLEGSKISSIVIGSGINVNQDHFPDDILNLATSLKKESGRTQSREALIKHICQSFEGYFDLFMKTKDISGFLTEYNQRLISRERMVTVLDPKGEFAGKALGVNAHGELLVKKESGQVVSVYAGEISVRGIYGYV